MSVPQVMNPLIGQKLGSISDSPLLNNRDYNPNGHLNQNGTVHPNGLATDSSAKPSNWVPIQERYLYEKRKIRVITIGAGFSGLMVAHKVIYPPTKAPNDLALIFERSNMSTSSKTAWIMSSTRKMQTLAAPGSRTRILVSPATSQLISTRSYGDLKQASGSFP
jgi:hypothetical protein